MIRPLALLAVALASIVPASARAQAELSPDEEATGIRINGWRINPSAELEAGYETNVRRLNDPDQVEDPDDVVWQASASLSASRQGGEARLETSVVWDLRKYVRNSFLDAFADVDAGASLVVNPEGNVDFRVSERFTHETRPLEQVELGLLRRTGNTLKLASGWHPGGPMEATPHARWTYENFFDDEKLLTERHTLALGGGGTWLFYPRTAFALDAEVGHTFYTASIRFPNDPAFPDPGGPVNADATFWRLLGGVTGKFTEKLSAQVKVGVSDAQYRSGPSSGVTLVVESVARWKVATRGQLSAGYTRSIVDAYFTNYYVADRGVLRYKHLVRDRFTLSGEAAVEHQRYSEPFSRRDTVIWAQPAFATRIGRWFDLGVRYRYLQRLSSDETPAPLPGADPAPSYLTHSIFVGLEATY